MPVTVPVLYQIWVSWYNQNVFNRLLRKIVTTSHFNLWRLAIAISVRSTNNRGNIQWSVSLRRNLKLTTRYETFIHVDWLNSSQERQHITFAQQQVMTTTGWALALPWTFPWRLPLSELSRSQYLWLTWSLQRGSLTTVLCRMALYWSGEPRQFNNLHWE